MSERKSIPAFEEIFSMENMFRAWKKFRKGKKNKKDAAEFSMRLVHNLSVLKNDILSGKYKHGGYKHFKINDPKPRDIHKASVRDRILHHVLYDALYQYFDRKFIHDSYSCRSGKGMHRAIERFESFGRKESLNFSRIAWILKCDIRKCFASVNRDILKSILAEHVTCPKTFAIVREVIGSFPNGLPLGNLTSQLFINIYLNELDLYVKHKIKADKYIRYADDFVIFSRGNDELVEIIHRLRYFLKIKLDLQLHPDKIFIKKLQSGVDFLGWVHFPKYRVLRTSSKKRMFRKSQEKTGMDRLVSYIGMLKHGNTHKLEKMLILKHGSVRSRGR